MSWNQSSLNRGILATRGSSQSLALELAVPGSDSEFYKLTFRGEVFYPITNEWVLRFRTELGYGDGYGNTTNLPFFEHFFAGGFGSVRGFESNTLGPRSTPAQIYSTGQPITEVDEDGNPVQRGGEDGRLFGYVMDPDTGKLTFSTVNNRRDPDPFGGNALIVGGVELLFPLPFLKDRRKLRSAFFVDAGNVFNTKCSTSQVNCFDVDAGELRYSVGVGVTWITGFGPMSFSLAKPLNDSPQDEREIFQFTLGKGF
jgi:outer membrane protein insertion porin family